MNGLIFSIEEFAVFDGEGIRVNVFLKGCPLRCKWCHNPEGWEKKIQIVKNPNGCLQCGICDNICTSPENCVLCSKCIINCPRGLIRESGKWMSSDELSKKLLKFENVLKVSGGGLTFSGGEVLMQADFLCEVLDKTSSMHRIIETSGYGDSDKFSEVLKRVDFVYYDLKFMDDEKHKKFTGVSNKLILDNAQIMLESGVPCVIRVPFIHNVNTDKENIINLCEFIKNATNVEKVELLCYNKMAGAKYKMMGLEYNEEFSQPDSEDLKLADEIFKLYNLNYSVSF